MLIFTPIISARIIFIAALINIITILLIYLSCRCLPTSRIGKNWMKNATYKNFYKYHCYLWWIFVISVIIHIVFAIARLGVPF